ncbi:MAG: ABC transporter permease, partial [Kineosporiaceae bacterium]
ALAAPRRWDPAGPAAPGRATGARPAPVPLGPLRVPVGLAAWTVLGAALGLPLAVFAGWAVRGGGEPPFPGGDAVTFLSGPVVNSAAVSVAAAAVTAIALLPTALASVRRPGPLARATTALVTSTLALPGLVTALALVFFALGAPGPLGLLYQSFPLLVLGYVLHFGAQSLRASQAAVAAVPAQLHETARLLGAGPWRRFVTIDVPLLLPGVAAGAGLVMLSTLKELPATALLAPIGFDTLATSIYFAAEDGFFGEVGVASLVLVAVSAGLTWGLVVRPGASSRARA